MKGILTPEQQLSILAKIWGRDREGFVFLPWIEGKCKTKEERKAKYHEGQAFAWPGDQPQILAYLTQHRGDDMYFAPCLFFDQRRIESYAITEATLWADLDEVDPRVIDDHYQPTIAWESSPGRYQAVWILQGELREGTSWGGKENHRLTMYLGADQSGWDTTQLLRVPGSLNHKPEYRDGSNPVQGQLLWDAGRRYTIDEFDNLPEVSTIAVGDVDLVDEEVIHLIDRHSVWGRVRLKLTSRCRDYMAVRSSTVADDIGKDQPEGRSGVQWQIMCELAHAGCTVAEIVAVLRPSVWNTFSGRSDELKRLKIGAAKAVAKIREATGEGDDGDALEVIDIDKPALRWLTEAMAVSLRRPSWIVRNVWSTGGCGFIAGDPKSYKSWIGLDLAVSVATGTPFLNDKQFATVGGPKPVLYLQEEDSEIVVRDRLDTIVEGKVPHLHWHGYTAQEGNAWAWYPPAGDIPLGFHVRSGFTASDPGWQSWLAEVITQGSFAHVVIDTLGTTAGDIDTDRAPELMHKILRPLKDISNQSGCAITVVHHNRKGTNGDQRGGQRMLGSVSLHAWVDDALYVHSREPLKGGATKVRVERESKSSTEHKWTLEIPRMGVGGDGARTVWEPLIGLWDASTDVPSEDRKQRNQGPPAGSKIANAVFLLGGNESHPTPLSRVATTAAIPLKSVQDQIKAAIANGLVMGTLEGGVWSA